MTMQLSKPGSDITASTSTAIARVTQDYQLDGSVKLTIHTEERLAMPDGSQRSLGPWASNSATYPSLDVMVALTAQTWAVNADLATLAAEVAKGPREAAAAVLGAYTEILDAANAAMAAAKTQE